MLKPLFYPSRHGQPERHFNRMRAPLVARPSSCGAMARWIDTLNDHRLPARQTAGFFVSGERT
jgi:hypothetical protein